MPPPNPKLTMLSNILVSKARRPKFELVLKIIDLNNVPLVNGTSYVKWHLPSSTSAEHRGRTNPSPIKEHKVSWDYTKTIPVRLTIDKNNNLQECSINFEVVQDYNSAGMRGEKITLGYVTLNLAEYVEESEMGPDGEEGVVRRYLMQESKINSTLKIGILMKQVDGERNFVAPPLKTAPVFGGIAGIMAGEQAEQDDVGHMPTISKSRDHGELQDMYRRALAASWAAHEDELPADQCLEDIFNGGDGWKTHDKVSTPRITHDDSGEERNLRHHHRSTSGASSKSGTSQSTITGKRVMRMGHRHSRSRETLGPSSQSALDMHDTSSENSSDRGRTGFKKAPEVDEFDIRDDLVAWRLPSTVS
ncbi:N-terminal C2 in EEIG1 and EHBP1 proteins-domain-containing protein [Cadophora sp. MPI-SDFR-AT-0126]|nr:N-terminal C2 in EEIG1 and EHBP1 proteins-domain-containing protein [Leotiomycetes sp. MPI-SDFR-AT-0126]